MTERVAIRREEEGIALLLLQDTQGGNAFDERFIADLLACLETLARDPDVRVCIVRGLPDVFCAGASQALLLALAEGRASPSDIVLSKMLLDLPFPTIAAMEGHALGGGLALGLCCDVLLLARESRYGCSFMNLGFTPGMGITRLLQLAVGEYVAAEMLYGGQFFKGSHFAARGAVNYVLPRADVFPQALAVARRFADKPRLSLELLKRYLSLPRRMAFEETRTVEAAMHRLSFQQAETARRIREEYAPPAGSGK